MMKKSVHIIIVCLFFLLGLQSSAGERKTSSLPSFETSQNSKSLSCSSYSNQKKNSYFSSPEKLLKKRKFSKTQQNAITNLSKCKGFSISAGSVSSSKYQSNEYSEPKNGFSGSSFHKSFCHRKLLSIFYSFQAFW